jgi:hypothetical protein
MLRHLQLPLGLLLVVTGANASAAFEVDKRAYSWGNPTPDNLLRELATDRPDVTESPFTVDAGHVQLELDLVNYTRNQLDGVRTTEIGVAPLNLRFGLRHNFELGIFLSPYIRATEQPRGGAKSTASGFGDTIIRGKWNFAGNDGGESAVGLIVDLKLPTAARAFGSDKVEGTVLLPVDFELPGGWSLGAMTGLSAVHNGTSYRTVLINTVTVGHDLTKDLGGYAELTSVAGDGPHVCTFDLGLGYRLDRNRQVDCGVNIGISRNAPDVLVFTGYSQRF